MRVRLSRLAALLVVALIAAACGTADTPPAAPPTATAAPALAAATATNPPPTATAVPATDTPAPAVEAPTDAPAAPTDTPLSAPTEAPAPTDTPAAVATFGLTEDGLYFRGNPAAAVTVIDYSDFL
jgi:hypothetical protein